MKPPLSELSTRIIILLTLFSLTINISEAMPVRDGISGNDAAIWNDVALSKFYGPWSSVKKWNEDYPNYNYHEEVIQDFQPGPEDVPADEPEIADGDTADFQSNYGEAGDEIRYSEPVIVYDQSSVNDHYEGDETGGGDPDNHDLEGNVHWTE